MKICFRCNNLCDFCAQGRKRELYGDKTLGAISAELKKWRDKGSNRVVFTGGEPTLHPDIIEAVRAAKKLGFKRIQIQSNGRRLAYMEFCKALLDAGVNEFSPALHGSKAELHDALTHCPGSFAQTLKGVRNARSLGARLIMNTVVTSANFKDLPDLAKLLCHMGVDQFQFAFVHPVGRAWDNRSRMVPRKTDAIGSILAGLDVGLKSGVRCYTEAIPYCFMKGYESCLAETIIPDGPVVDADFSIAHYAKYRKTKGKAKGAKCRDCARNDVCEGPWRQYPLIYGWNEFRPVG